MHRNFDAPGRSPVYASECAAATSHPLATATALNILREGGNAVDAAIAASATLCVVEPHMTGVGGDCFAIVCEPDGSLHCLNGSGRSAADAKLEWYLGQGFSDIPGNSVHSVTAPGAVMAWETLHGKLGAMDFTRLFADAIHYAEEGFPIAPRVAYDWAKLVSKLSANPAASKFLLNNGKSPETGSSWQFPALAGVLRRIATEGSKALYSGETAREIATTVQGLGGFLTEGDLAKVATDWVDPIHTIYNGHELHEIPPNGQGITALILANLISKIGPATGAGSPERAHLEAECGRIAYAARDAYVADADHMTVPYEELLSKAHTELLAKLYDRTKRNPDISLPDPSGSDTVYLSIVDRDQRAVSFINSVYSHFGSGIVTPQSGIVLQNRGSCFNVKAGHPNAIGPSKRPLHTITPAMVTKNGKPTHCFGVMGGAYQPMGHVHVLSNMLDYGMDPQQALDHPRIFWNDEGTLVHESCVPDETIAYLKARGHPCQQGGPHGGGQVIRIDYETGTLVAGSDARKDGHAAGF